MSLNVPKTNIFLRSLLWLWLTGIDSSPALYLVQLIEHPFRECIRNLDLRVQVHPGELWFSKQRVHIVLEASKSAGAKGDVPKICTRCTRSNAFPAIFKNPDFHSFTYWVFFQIKVLNQYQNTNIICYIKKKKKTSCNTLNRGNWNSGFGKWGVRWAEHRDTRILYFKKPKDCFYLIRYLSLKLIYSYRKFVLFENWQQTAEFFSNNWDL